MKCELNTKWHKGSTYSVGSVEDNKLPIKASFGFLQHERFKENKRFKHPIEDSINCLNMSELETEIVARVALSKYLTVRQIVEFMKMQGISFSEIEMRDCLFAMEQKRILMRYKMFIPNKQDTLIFYGLNFWGMMKARHDMGKIFHRGIVWYTENERLNRRIPEDTSTDVKRILVGNQILLGLLKSGIAIERMGVMETFRSISDEPNPPLFRPTVNVKLNPETILAYEVVRTYPSSYMELAAKMKRFYDLLEDKHYLKKNYHDYEVQPQIIICGQDLQHNLMIKKYLQERGVWNQGDVTILFTEDLLNVQDVNRSIYEIDDSGEVVWYEFQN